MKPEDIQKRRYINYEEIFTVEIITLTGGLIAGLMLASYLDKLALVPGLFILLPGFLEMRGNISGSLSGRLSSGLFLGAVKPRFRHQSLLTGNILASFAAVITVSLALGLLAYFLSGAFFGTADLSIVWIALLAGVLSNLIEIPLAIATVFWLFRHGHDPNDIMGPYITTIGDIFSILALLIAVMAI
ncbi:MAG: magnesium transporter [Candidatus Aenigmatarchaeota archaeon]